MEFPEVRDNYSLKNFLYDLVTSGPFISVHLGCLLVFFVDFSWWAVTLCLFLYVIRMFGITAGFHRYFSHRSFKTSRVFQFVLGVIATAAAQRGPLWWAAHHRHHHKHSDQPEDAHSPHEHGFFWSHVGWVMNHNCNPTKYELVKDIGKYREIYLLNQLHMVVPIALAFALLALGSFLGSAFPESGISGLQFLVWGFFVSTTLLYHGTFVINSLTHVIGTRRFETDDESRNNLILALITLGEGWHNNHHRYPASERQGFYWYEIDLSHMALRLLSFFGIVWDLKSPPKRIYDEAEERKNKLLQSQIL